MKSLLLLLFTFLTHYALAAFTVVIELENKPVLHQDENIFVTGNFNNWKPDDSLYVLQKLANGRHGITLHLKDIPSDRLEFKFTRGDWQTLECNNKGRLEIPRILELNKDTLVRLTIQGWRDDFPASTASPQVRVLDSAMFIPAFNAYRTVWIYLPQGYEHSRRRYPVIYMHDGQQMFDEATSTGRIGPIEWGVDEHIDEADRQSIVIAVNHNDAMSKRIEEYLVIPNPENPVANGKQYLSFIVDSLKPFVDKQYRTLSDKKNTTLMGSSMGGLVSLYGGLMYPQVFGNLGILSPSIWYDDGNIEKYIETTPLNTKQINQQRYFFYAGSNENRKMPNGQFVKMDKDVNRVIDILKQKVNPGIKIQINPNGRHGGTYWREAFPDFYQWLTEKK